MCTGNNVAMVGCVLLTGIELNTFEMKQNLSMWKEKNQSVVW